MLLQHIMVTLDGSQLAEEALSYARGIVAPEGRITLLSVVDVPEFPMYSFYPTPVVTHEGEYSSVLQELLEQSKLYLNKIADDLKAAGLQAEVRVEVGEPAGVIVEQARELAVDAIVMSTHGRSGFSRWLFGSITQKVLSVMPCPVFVVPGLRDVAKTESGTSTTGAGS